MTTDEAHIDGDLARAREELDRILLAGDLGRAGLARVMAGRIRRRMKDTIRR